jgi:hypothetical protein
MIHHRKRIRDRIVDKLKAANIGGVNQNVAGSVFFPFPKGETSICVYPSEEQSARVAGQYERTVAIVVQIAATAAQNVEDLIDEICAEVESAIQPLEVDELANGGALRATEFERSGEGDEEIMTASLTYVFTYSTTLYNPTAAVH